jgi:hypothetical protein
LVRGIPRIQRKDLLSLALIMLPMSETGEDSELWYGWTANELHRAGLLYLGKGAAVLIIGLLVFLYQSSHSFAVSMIFFVLGGVELWLGQWFFRQSNRMISRR